MHKNSLNNLKPFTRGNDSRRNTKGRPKGSKNLATLIRELEDPDFNWTLIPIKPQHALYTTGTPWRAIVYVALAKSLSGDVRAMEWLRRAGYGNKVTFHSNEISPKGHNKLEIEVVNGNYK